MAKPGRKTREFTKAELLQVTEWVKMGMKESTIAHNLGLNPSTLSAKKQTIPELDQAIKDGYKVQEEIIVGELFRIATDRDHRQQMTALIFYAKTRLKWNDTVNVQMKSLPSSMTIGDDPE